MRRHTIISLAVCFLSGLGAELATGRAPRPVSSGVGQDPTARTLEADSITSSSAHIRAFCNPNGAMAGAFFRWGRTIDLETDYGSTAFRSIGDGTSEVEFSETIKPLMPGETYYYRVAIMHIDATNENALSDIRSFTTNTDTSALWMAIPLRVAREGSYGWPIRFGVHSFATACGDPGLGEYLLPPRPPESSMETRFLGRCLDLGQYVDLRNYHSPAQIDTYHVSFLSGGTGYPVTISWPALDSFYTGPVGLHTIDTSVDMLASTSYAITNSDIEDFRIIAAGPTPKRICPAAVTDTVSATAATAAHLRATIYPHGLATTAWFEWGSTSQYGNKTPPKPLGDTIGAVTLEADVSGLTGHSLYHFRAVARNSAATIQGADQVFSTLPGLGEGFPLKFSLHQNYPNPFNPTTNIQYDLPIDAYVVLRIFDLLGREVRTLVNGPEPSGFRSVTIDGTGLPTGVYFYRITAGDFTDVKKLVITR